MQNRLVTFFFTILAISTHTFASYYAYVANEDSTISGYLVDDSNGDLIALSGSPFTVGDVSCSTVFIAITPNGNYLYVSNTAENTFIGCSIDGSTGALSTLSSSPFTAGAVPFFLATTPNGKYLYVTNSAPGNIYGFSIDSGSGALTSVPGSPFAADSGTEGIAISPNGDFLYVANYDSDSIYGYSIDSSTGALIQLDGATVFLTSPNQIAITSNGKYLYASDFGTGLVYGYSINSGSLSPVPGSPFTAIAKTSGIASTPNGRFLYAANLTGYDISGYSINSSNGTLTPLTNSPFSVGAACREVAITPDGLYLYVTNDEIGEITGFSIDSSGNLTSIPGSPFTAGDLPYGIAITQILQSSASLTGKRVTNNFPFQKAAVNLLAWTASPSSNVVSYNVYRNGKLIASVPASTLSYSDPSINRKLGYIYSVTAVNTSGVESPPVTVSIL